MAPDPSTPSTYSCAMTTLAAQFGHQAHQRADPNTESAGFAAQELGEHVLAHQLPTRAFEHDGDDEDEDRHLQRVLHGAFEDAAFAVMAVAVVVLAQLVYMRSARRSRRANARQRRQR